MPYTTKEMLFAMHFRSHAQQFLAVAILAGSALLPTAASAQTLSSTWIQSKTNDGSVVITADGLVWSVEMIDRVMTGLWLPADNITYLADTHSKCLAPNATVLFNTDESRPTGEQACAVQLSGAPAPAAPSAGPSCPLAHPEILNKYYQDEIEWYRKLADSYTNHSKVPPIPVPGPGAFECAAPVLPPPAVSATDTYSTGNGVRTSSQIQAELRGAGYSGPFDVPSLLAAYQRATNSPVRPL
jgi:hypothetical protein